MLALDTGAVGGKHPLARRQHGLQPFAHGQAAADAHEVVIYRVEAVFVWGVHDSLIVASSARAAKREVKLLCLGDFTEITIHDYYAAGVPNVG